MAKRDLESEVKNSQSGRFFVFCMILYVGCIISYFVFDTYCIKDHINGDRPISHKATDQNKPTFLPPLDSPGGLRPTGGRSRDQGRKAETRSSSSCKKMTLYFCSYVLNTWGNKLLLQWWPWFFYRLGREMVTYLVYPGSTTGSPLLATHFLTRPWRVGLFDFGSGLTKKLGFWVRVFGILWSKG